MTIKEFEERALSTLTDSCNNVTYATTGLMGEVGELMELIAKGRRRGEISIIDNTLVSTSSDEDVAKAFFDKIGDETFDVIWFCVLTCHVTGQSLDEVIERGLAKLAHRKKTNTIDTHTDH